MKTALTFPSLVIGSLFVGIALVVDVVEAVVPRYGCDPCIYRSAVNILGFTTSPKIKDAADKTAADLGVNLDMRVYPGGSAGVEQIAADMTAATYPNSSRVDAMIVSSRGAEINAAIEAAANVGIPTFGLDAASLISGETSIVSAVGANDKDLGTAAARIMLSIRALSDATFLSIPSSNGQVPRRAEDAKQAFLQGFNLSGAEVAVNNLDYDYNDNSTDIGTLIEGCPGGLMISNQAGLEAAVTLLTARRCEETVVGVIFSEDITRAEKEDVFQLINDGEVDFALGQELQTQGIFGTIMASLYATTGLALAPNEADEDGRYIINPILYTRECLADDTCLGTFPTATSSTNSTSPPVRTIKVGAVSHGVAEDTFWDPVYAAAFQAAADMNVELDFERFTLPESEEGTSSVIDQMNEKITSLCNDDTISGIFVSLDEGILESVRECQSRGIPLIVINSGYWYSTNSLIQTPFNYVGQRDYNAGYLAGEKLSNECRGCAFFCLNHAPGVAALDQRCEALKDSVTEALETNTFPVEPYVTVDISNQTNFILSVEQAVAQSNSTRGDLWNKVALLTGGQQNLIEYALALKESHPGVTIAAFDLSEAAYQGLDEDKIAFAVDQQPYIQGYWPVALLSIYLKTGQTLAPFHIQSGPSFVERSPSEAEIVCIDNNFQVCDANVTFPPTDAPVTDSPVEQETPPPAPAASPSSPAVPTSPSSSPPASPSDNASSGSSDSSGSLPHFRFRVTTAFALIFAAISY